jgi:hypothetical protein
MCGAVRVALEAAEPASGSLYGPWWAQLNEGLGGGAMEACVLSAAGAFGPGAGFGGSLTLGCGRGNETCGWALSPSKAGCPAMSGGGGDGDFGRRDSALDSNRMSRVGKNLELLCCGAALLVPRMASRLEVGSCGCWLSSDGAALDADGAR